MKKAFALGLLVVMLLVSFLPCADAKGFGSSEKTNPAFAKTNKQDNHQQQDVCPPFCQCGCCSVVSIHHSFQAGFTPFVPNHQAYLPQPANAIVQKPHDIWQPPKL